MLLRESGDIEKTLPPSLPPSLPLAASLTRRLLIAAVLSGSLHTCPRLERGGEEKECMQERYQVVADSSPRELLDHQEERSILGIPFLFRLALWNGEGMDVMVTISDDENCCRIAVGERTFAFIGTEDPLRVTLSNARPMLGETNVRASGTGGIILESDHLGSAEIGQHALNKVLAHLLQRAEKDGSTSITIFHMVTPNDPRTMIGEFFGTKRVYSIQTSSTLIFEEQE